MQPKIKRWLTIAAASVLTVGVVASSVFATNGSLPNLFAETADGGGPLKADPVTLGSWTDLDAGQVWTDKSVYTSTLTLQDKDESVTLTPKDGNFGVGLSVLSAGDTAAVSGDVTFTEPLGRFMEVKEVDGLFYGDGYHTVDNFIAYFERATADQMSEIESFVGTRIPGTNGKHIIEKALADGYLTHDVNWIDWYENARGEYVESVGNAVAQNRSYFFHGIRGVQAMGIEVRVRTDLSTNEQVMTFSVPQNLLPRTSATKTDTPLRLFYQVGVSSTYDFSDVPESYEFQDISSVDAFLSTRDARAEFLPTTTNEYYRHLNATEVKKTQNVTETYEYVSLADKLNGMNGPVTVYHGNNGRVTVTKPGSVELSARFVENEAKFYGDLDRLTYRLEFEGDFSNEYAVSTSQGVINVNEFGLADVNITPGTPMIIYNVEPGVTITATCRTEEKDYEMVNERATCSVHAGEREQLAFMVKYTGEIPEDKVPLPSMPPDTPKDDPLETPPEFRDLVVKNEVIGELPSGPDSTFEYTVLLQGDVSSFGVSNIKMPEGREALTELKGTNSKTYRFVIGANEQVMFDDVNKGVKYTVTQVTDHKDYVLSYTSNRTGTLNANQTVTATNTSMDAASYTIEVTNNLTGTVPFDSLTFNYELQSSHELANGSMREVKSITFDKANGSEKVAFDTISYTQAGVYSYSIYQDVRDRTGAVWDKSVFNINVTVTKNGNTLTVSPEITRLIDREGNNVGGVAAGSVAYDNKYEPQTVKIPGFDVMMRLKGDVADYTGDFRITIDPDNNWSPYQGEHRELTISYDAATYNPKELYKSAKFDEITFDKPGQYLYVIKVYDGQSLPGSNRNMNYNTLAYRWLVTVKADASGKLTASQNLQLWTYQGDYYRDTADRIVYFEVEYTKPEFGEVTNEFKMQSVVEGDKRDGKTTLRYQLSKVENRKTDSGMIIHEDYPMPIKDVVAADHEGTGTIKLNFGEALYSVPGTSVYKVKQLIGNIAGMEYDKSEFEITVKAVNSSGTNRMSIESVIINRVVAADGTVLNGTHAGNKPERVSMVKFVNTYHPLDGVANIPFNLTLDGDDYNGEFNFEIMANDDKNPMPGENTESMTFAGASEVNGRWVGYGQFDAIQYTALGDYEYTVRQVPGRTAGMIYDQSEFKVVVKMVDDGGHLRPEFKYYRLKNFDGSVAGGAEERVIQWNNGYNELTDLVVDVVWITDDGLDRPAYVDIQRYADKGVFGDTVRLSTANAWHYEWVDSDADIDWEVAVADEDMPDGFEQKITRDGNHITITLDDIFPEGEMNRISAIVVFENDHGRTDKPENLQLLLRENGIIFGRALDVNEEHDWRYSWHGLREGQEYTVEVVDEVKGWDVDIVNDGHNNVTITFKSQPIVPDPIDLTVNVSQDIQYGRERFKEVAVQLYRDGEAFGDPLYVGEDTGWSHTWPGLDGSYDWTVDEPTVPEGFWRFINPKDGGKTYDIINYDFPIPDEGKTVKVVKIWDNVPQWRFEPVGKPSSGDKETDEKYGLGIYGTLGEEILEQRPEMVPAEVLVQLKVGGAPVGEAVSLNDENGWQYAWTGLDEENDYQVVEVTKLDKFETVAKNNDDNWVITNKYVDKWYEELSIKAIWNVSDLSTVPEILKIQLFRDGEPFGSSVEMKKSDGWVYKFEHLQRDHKWTFEPEMYPGYDYQIKEEDGVQVLTIKYVGAVESPKPDDTDDDRPGWNQPDDDDTSKPGDGDDDNTSKPDGVWGNGQGGNGSNGNQNNNGTGITTVPGDNTANNISNGIGVGSGIGGNGSGSGSGSTTTIVTGSSNDTGKTNNNADLANPNKYATPQTGVENNMVWLWVVLGCLAVVGAGIGGYLYWDKKKKEKM